MTSVVELEEADVDRESLHNFTVRGDLKACLDNSYHHARSLWKFEFSRTVLFGQENKKSNFHNFLHGDMNNPDESLIPLISFKNSHVLG